MCYTGRRVVPWDKCFLIQGYFYAPNGNNGRFMDNIYGWKPAKIVMSESVILSPYFYLTSHGILPHRGYAPDHCFDLGLLLCLKTWGNNKKSGPFVQSYVVKWYCIFTQSLDLLIYIRWYYYIVILSLLLTRQPMGFTWSPRVGEGPPRQKTWVVTSLLDVHGEGQLIFL